MKIYEHIEHYLGPITKSWSLKDQSPELQVLKFDNELKENVSTYVTLGLSNTILSLGQKNVRHEFVFAAYDSFNSEDIASFLLTFSLHVKETGKGMLRGEFVEGKPLISNVKSTGVYASIPVFWDENFQVFNGMIPPVAIVWLMPLLKDEALFIQQKGWNQFEDILEKAECDFWDLNRGPISFLKVS